MQITISTLTGDIITISAAGVWRILQGTLNEAGGTHTLVDYDGGQQETDEPISRLLAALAAAKIVLVRLTTPAHTAVYLNPTAVTGVQAAQAGIDAPGALSAITIAGHRQAVIESPAQASKALATS